MRAANAEVTPARDASLFRQGSEALTAPITHITDDERGRREGASVHGLSAEALVSGALCLVDAE